MTTSHEMVVHCVQAIDIYVCSNCSVVERLPEQSCWFWNIQV